MSLTILTVEPELKNCLRSQAFVHMKEVVVWLLQTTNRKLYISCIFSDDRPVIMH